MKDLDQFNLLAFSAMEQKLDYKIVLTQYKTLALIQLMLVLHALVSYINFDLVNPISCHLSHV